MKTLVSIILCCAMLLSAFALTGCEISFTQPNTDNTTYTVTFLNYDNSLLYKATGIKEGEPAVYAGDTPTRPDTNEATYTFAGWDKDISAIYSDLAVFAKYTEVKKDTASTTTPTIPDDDDPIIPDEDDEPTTPPVDNPDQTYSVTYRDVKTATIPNDVKTYDNTQGLELPENIVEKGYVFIGWSEKKQITTYRDVDAIPFDLVLVDHIPAGTGKNVTVYAHWAFVNYDIAYKSAGVHSNPITYTIEDEVKLSNPEWTGLIFNCWKDSTGKAVTKIPKGTTGNMTLSASWYYNENISTQAKNNNEPIIAADPSTGLITLFYNLGTIENVVLKILDQKFVDGTGQEWTESKSYTFDQNIANTVSETVGTTITEGEQFEDVYEYLTSDTHGFSGGFSAGVEIGLLNIIKTSLSLEFSESHEHTESDTVAHTDIKFNENSVSNDNTFSSHVSYTQGFEETVSETAIVPAGMPKGYYSRVSLGTVQVFAIVVYDPVANACRLETYSYIKDVYNNSVIYRPSNDLDVDISTSEPLSFNVDPDDIIKELNNLEYYYIEFDGNGAAGSMPKQLALCGKEIQLLKNTFESEGRTCIGWTAPGVSDFINDEQKVKDLAKQGETITLKAEWVPISYTAKWNNGVNCSIKVERTSSPLGKASIGTLKSGDFVYFDDVLKITYTSNTGYEIGSIKGQETITVKGDVTANDIYATATTKAYKVKFELSGGSGTSERSFTYGMTTQAPPDPTREGHYFNGWKFYNADTNATITFSFGNMMPAHNIKAIAQWTPEKYKITLKTNGGSIYYGNSEPLTSYIYGQGADLPFSINRDGYTFAGWYTEDNGKGDFTTSISSSDVGDKTYYAYWAKREIYSTTAVGTSFSISDHTTNETYSGITLITLYVPEELRNMVSIGKLYVSVYVDGAASLQYRSNKEAATASIVTGIGIDYGVYEHGWLKATGDGWGSLSKNPTYGSKVEQDIAFSGKEQVPDNGLNRFLVEMYFKYEISFEEYKNWAGGTHAVNFSCDLSNITYVFVNL